MYLINLSVDRLILLWIAHLFFAAELVKQMADSDVSWIIPTLLKSNFTIQP